MLLTVICFALVLQFGSAQTELERGLPEHPLDIESNGANGTPIDVLLSHTHASVEDAVVPETKEDDLSQQTPGHISEFVAGSTPCNPYGAPIPCVDDTPCCRFYSCQTIDGGAGGTCLLNM